ncbi:hypothetical protein D0T92_05295 [Neisseria zalophi]|uniref:Uncharacterized protein n=1 Tax=Neisseria zalophi TaxID=640030 RepID=A0A5J6PU02_9NEIS|nr:hypothetical protein D0T92_05295 [Neisseria zalophi]
MLLFYIGLVKKCELFKIIYNKYSNRSNFFYIITKLLFGYVYFRCLYKYFIKIIMERIMQI